MNSEDLGFVDAEQHPSWKIPQRSKFQWFRF